jgi:hypothetical protein
MTFFYDLNKRLAGLTADQTLTESKKQTKKNVEEADMDEGNEFSGELSKAKATGKKEFEVDGKTYPVKEDAKPDYIDLDNDGDRKESMKKAAKDKKAMKESGDVMDEELDEAWMTEKWDTETSTPDSKKGMFKGKTKAELESQLAKLKKSGPHEKDSAAFTKMKQLQFAIRAKSDWGKIDEEEGRPYVVVHARKGKTEVNASSSYEAAKKAAAKWGLKNTAGCDAYLADTTHTAVDEEAAGTDFNAEKAEKKVKLKTNRGVEPGTELDEGQMKQMMHKDAERMERAKFCEKYGNEDWVGEFWDNIMGDLNEEVGPKTDDALRNFYKKQKAEKMKRASSKRDYYEDNTTEDAEPVEYSSSNKPAYNGMTFESVTRKHFQQIADLLKNIENMDKRSELAQHHADIFATQNPRFSKEKFFKAVGLDTVAEDMKVGDTRKSSTGGTIEKTKTGVKHTAKEYNPDEEEVVDAPKRKRGGQSKDFGKKEYSFSKDEKALAAHKKQPKGKVHAMKEEELDEKAVSQAQQKAAGIARAVQKGETKAKKGSASAEMAKMEPSELKKFASTKHKGLPKKVKEESTSYPDDVPTVGDRQSVSKPGKTMGITYGKGVYEALDAQLEKLIKLNEGSDYPHPSTVRDNERVQPKYFGENDMEETTSSVGDQIVDLLKNAGLISGHNQDMQQSVEVCNACDCAPCECSTGGNEGDLVAFELAEADVDVSLNEPDYPTNGEESDDALQYSGGLNGPKSTGQTTVPVIASQLRRQATMEDAAETDSFLNLFKVFKNIVK